MSAQIVLKDLSSFFELFVAYTFAYSNLTSVKDGVNKASVKDLDKKVLEYEAIYLIESENAKDISIVNSSVELDSIILERISTLNQKVINLRNLKFLAETIYSGNFLRPIFYLTGAIYLFYIVLSAFQEYIGNLTILLIIDTITVCTIIFYFIYYYYFVKDYLNLDFEKVNWEFPTKKTLLHSLWIILLIVIGSFLKSNNIHENYPIIGKYNEGKFNSSCFFTKTETYNCISYFGIMSLACIPFFTFYIREKLISKKIDKNIKSNTLEFNAIMDEIKTFSKVKNDIFKFNKTDIITHSDKTTSPITKKIVAVKKIATIKKTPITKKDSKKKP